MQRRGTTGRRRTRGAVAAGLLLTTGCAAASGTSGAGAPEAAAPARGEVAFFGALPEDTSSGALVLDLATGERVRAGDQQEAWAAAWVGPDRLAVVRGPARISDDGPGELVIAAADGSDDGTPVGGVADVRNVASSTDGELALLGREAWSSGACLDAAPTARMGLYLAAADGSGVRRVADVSTASRSLALSPDGRTAALVDSGDDAVIPPGRDWCNPGETRLVLVDTTTGTARVVTGTPGILGEPRFSPDGATVVLDGGNGHPDSDLVVVDVASASAEVLRTPDVVETSPAFSPDGQRLAVLRHDAGGDPAATATIAVGAPDGTGMRDVVPTGTEDYGLVWTPDGGHLLVAGSVIEWCGDAGDQRDAPWWDLWEPAGGGCDTAMATTDLRLVAATGGEPRQVSDTVTGFDAGLVAAAAHGS